MSCSQKTKAFYFSSPESGYSKIKCGDKVDGTFANFNSKCITQEEADGDSHDAQAVATWHQTVSDEGTAATGIKGDDLM